MVVALLSSAVAFARRWGDCALDLAFPWSDSLAAAPVRIDPPYCQQCGEPYPALEDHGPFTCSKCDEQKWHFAWARAAYQTEGQVLESVVGFKYRDEYYQAGRLTDWLTQAFDRHAAGEPWDAVVPVPLYHRRLRERGFNQAYELARGLGNKRDIRVSDCLYRYRETPSQAGLRRKKRFENMKDAFRLKAKFDVTGQNLLLIDDVFTTGATTNACAEALTQGGARHVAVLTVARS